MLGYGYDQAQIGLDHTLLGGLVALGDPAGKIDLLLRREKVDLADFLEVHPDRIGQICLVAFQVRKIVAIRNGFPASL